MTFRADQPAWLWVLVLLAPMAWAGWAWMRAMPPVRRATAILFRAALLGLLAAMLAGVSSVRVSDRLAVVAVIDVSGSVRRFTPPEVVAAAAGVEASARRAAGADGEAGAEAGGNAVGGAGAGVSGPGPSVLEGVSAWLARAARGRQPDDLLGVVVFDGRAAAIATPTLGLEALRRPLDVTLEEGTDIEQALDLALAMLPGDAAGRVVLISDGVETAGSALRAARRAAGRWSSETSSVSNGEAGAAREQEAASGAGAAGGAPAGGGIRIDVVPIEYSVEREVVVELLDAPARAPAGGPVTLRAVLRATQATRGVLRVVAEGQALDLNGAEPGTGRVIDLPAGRSTHMVTVPLGAGRVHRLEAIFEPLGGSGAVEAEGGGEGGGAGVEWATADTLEVNNRAEAITVTPGQGAVLVVDAVTPAGRDRSRENLLARTLRQEGSEVDVVAPEALPTDLLELERYDLIVLENTPADALGEGAQRRLARYVTELGGGLVMVGGPESFGAGGYRGSPLEPLLPVKLDLPEKLVVPGAAVVIVLDTSLSMLRSVMGGSRTQLEVANAGAALAIRSLDKGDLVGVVAFNSGYDVAVPLQRNSRPDELATIVRGLEASGGTNLPPALEEAYRMVRGAEAQVKHVIVLSDGLSRGRERLGPLADRMASDGIVVSAIAVGDDADAEGLQVVASRGGGQFYRVTDPQVLPRVFLRAVRVVRSPMIREVPFEPVVVDATSAPVEAVVSGAGGAGVVPRLNGLVLTQARREPTVINALATPGGEPVLAHWQAGLGQVAAFTSDAHDWASPWIATPAYRRFWTSMVRTIGRPAAERQADVTTRIDGDRLSVRVELAGGGPATGAEGTLTMPAAVYGPDGRRQDLRLNQTGPGVFEGEAASARSGGYVVTIAPRVGGRALAPIVAGAARPVGSEYRSLRSDRAALEPVAAVTGGRVLSLMRAEEAGLFDRSGVEAREARTPLWPVLLGWTVVALLLDVFTRRVAWDRLLPERGWMTEGAEGNAWRGKGVSVGRVAERVRARAASGGTVPALGEEDARAEAARARARRVSAGAVGSGPRVDAAVRDGAGPARDGEAAGAASGAGETGLRAAKRRARQRFEDDAAG